MQSDPIGLAGGANTYNYVGFNPLNGIDPLGLDILNLLKPNDPNYGASKTAFNPEGVLKVISHGNNKSINNQDALQFTKTIQNSDYFKKRVQNNQPIIVELNVCTTGANTTNGIGVELARNLKNAVSDNINVYVLAPSAPIWIIGGQELSTPYENWEVNRNLPNLLNPGQFNVFKNGKLIDSYSEANKNNPYYILGK